MAESFDGCIDSYAGYHGVVPPKLVESRLRELNENCHVLRYNEKKKTYVISVAWKGKVRHFKLKITTENFVTSYEIEGTKKQFPDLGQLLNYYENCRVDTIIGGVGNPLPNENPLSQNTVWTKHELADHTHGNKTTYRQPIKSPPDGKADQTLPCIHDAGTTEHHESSSSQQQKGT